MVMYESFVTKKSTFLRLKEIICNEALEINYKCRYFS